MSNAQNQMAARFREAHAPGNLIVLPNAWDVASARIAEDCGARAIATSSAAVAWSQGYPDGEKLPAQALIDLVAAIAARVNVPVSADSEAGFSSKPEDAAGFVVALARAGAVGINLEDRNDPPALLAAKIEAIRKACAREHLDVFVNARTDVYLKSLVPSEKALGETLTRGKLYRDAGADGFFVPALVDTAAMKVIAESIALPLNILVRKTLVPVAEMKSAGVRRISAGAGTAMAAYGAFRRAALELLTEGQYATMYREAEGCPNLNELLKQN